MSRQTVMGLAETSVTKALTSSDSVTSLYIEGRLAPKDYGTLLRQEIKGEYIRQYLVGIGGRDQMTPRDWGSLGGMLKEQNKHLKGFLSEIAEGGLTEGQIRARSDMYVNSAREAYGRAHERNAEALGFDQEKWELGEAEHCDDCIAFAGMGWQPIGTFPVPGEGETQCLTNCKCTKVYGSPETGARY